MSTVISLLVSDRLRSVVVLRSLEAVESAVERTVNNLSAFVDRVI